MSYGTSSHGELPELTPIDSVSTLLSNIENIKERERSTADKPLRYYRGLSKANYDLRPSILKKTRKFLSERHAFDPSRRIMRRNDDGKNIKEVKDYAVHMDSLRRENEASGRYSDMGRLWTFVKQEKP